MSIINTNARSLRPKIDSLLDVIEETDSSIAVVIETWMQDGDNIAREVEDLSLGAGVGLLYRNREPTASNGVSYGGVAVLWRECFGSFRKLDLKNPDRFEVLVTAGSVVGHSRKTIVVACYLPPNMPLDRAEKCMCYISDVIVEVKARFNNPYLFIAGDFNQWRIEDHLADFLDIGEAPVGPTSGQRSIDRIFLNCSKSIRESGTLAPLKTEDSRESDHRTAYCRIEMKRKESFKWEITITATTRVRQKSYLRTRLSSTTGSPSSRRREAMRRPRPTSPCSPVPSTPSFLSKRVPTCRG